MPRSGQSLAGLLWEPRYSQDPENCVRPWDSVMKAAERGRVILISVNSPGNVSTSIDPRLMLLACQCEEIEKISDGWLWRDAATKQRHWFLHDRLKASYDNACHVCVSPQTKPSGERVRAFAALVLSEVAPQTSGRHQAGEEGGRPGRARHQERDRRRLVSGDSLAAARTPCVG